MTKRRVCPACKEEAAVAVEKDEEGVVRYECASCDAKFRVRPKAAPKTEPKKAAAPSKEETAGAEDAKERTDETGGEDVRRCLIHASTVRDHARHAEEAAQLALDFMKGLDPRDPILFRIGRTLNQAHTALLTCRIDLDNLIRVIEDPSLESGVAGQREKAESP